MPWSARSARPHQASAGVAKKQYIEVVVSTRSEFAPIWEDPTSATRSEGDWTRQMAGPGHRPNAPG